MKSNKLLFGILIGVSVVALIVLTLNDSKQLGAIVIGTSVAALLTLALKGDKRLFAIVVGSSASALIVLTFLMAPSERQQIHNALITSTQLAPIPDSNYQAFTLGGMFSRSYWVAFTCNEAEFNKFIAASPGLCGVTPYIFPFAETHETRTTWDKPPERMRTAMRDTEFFWNVKSPRWQVPSAFWNSSAVRKRGRRYEIFISDKALNGFLLRDDDSGEVFLHISYS